MRIGYVHLNLAAESGDPRMFYNIAQCLKGLGHEVGIFTAQFDPACFPELNYGLDITVIPPPEPIVGETEVKGIIGRVWARFLREKRGTAAAMAVLEKLPGDLDALVVQNDQSYKLGIFYKKRNPKAKVIWIMNNAPWRRTKKDSAAANILSWFASVREQSQVRRALPGIDEIIVHDKEQAHLLRALGREARLLPIPAEYGKFYASVKPLDPKGEIALLGIGSLSAMRKYEDIIAAAGMLRKNGRNMRVVLICKDFWKDAGYRELLQNAAQSAGMAGAVEFYFDGASEEELQAILARSHFYVFPNHIKIWSMSSFEAMAAGLLLVVSDVTSVAEVLTDGENALFTRSEHPEDIAAQIEKILANPARYAQIASAGQEFVKVNLSWDKYAKDFEGLLKPV